MESFWLVLALGVVALPIFFALRHLERVPAAAMWAAAWTLFWIGGMSFELSARYPTLQALVDVAGPLFSTLMLAGALAFTGRERPRWLWPAAAGIVGARLVASLGGSFMLSVAIGSVLEGPLVVAAAVLLWRATPAHRATRAGRVVSVSLLGLVALSALQSTGLARWQGAVGLMLGMWIGLAILGGVFQLLAILERGSESERRRGEERALLRRLAAVVARAQDPYSALARTGREMKSLDVFQGFGIYVPNERGDGYVLLEDAAAPLQVPEALRHMGPDDRVTRLALETEEPVFIEDVASEPRTSAAFRTLGYERAVAAALRYGGEVLGLMGGGIAPGRRIDAEVRRFIGELVEELGLILAALRVRERMAEHARSLESERLTVQALVEAAPVGILLADTEGNVRLLNRVMAEQLGVEAPEAWQGRPKKEALLAARPNLQASFGKRAVAAMERVAMDPDAELSALELRTHGPDGDRVILVHARPVRDAGGQRIGRVWTTLDVTAERRVGEALSHAQRMETLGALAGGLAHDFNNQLTAILGNARLLLDDLPEEDPRRASLMDLERSAEHCSELTRGLLTFARPAPVSRRAVDLGRVLHDLEGLLRASLGETVRLEVSIQEDLPPLAADESQLRRVLTNLVVNARDAVSANGGGRVCLEARTGVTLAKDGTPAVEFSVRDDGLGMDEGTRRRIFDPFFTTKPKGAGTGLGLAIVYRIVEAHGGEISVESAPGRGSVFRVCWPIARGGDGKAAPGYGASSEPAGATVLLADDEPGVRRLARVVLERAGFKVLEAEDGEAAVECFRSHRDEVELLIVDWFMPRKSGLEALEEIRGLAPQLPAIVISGHLHGDGESSLPADVAFLPKPFGPRVLVERAVERLGRSAGP